MRPQVIGVRLRIDKTTNRQNSQHGISIAYGIQDAGAGTAVGAGTRS